MARNDGWRPGIGPASWPTSARVTAALVLLAASVALLVTILTHAGPETAGTSSTAPSTATVTVTAPAAPAAEAVSPSPAAATVASGVASSPSSAATASKVVVPFLAGMSENEARPVLELRQLRVGDVATEDSRKPVGTVIRQVPVAGSFVAPGSSVSFVVSAGVEVPPVVGLPESEAENVLTEAGLDVQVLNTYVDSGPAGVVLAEDPESGAYAEAGSGVKIMVGRLRPTPTSTPTLPPTTAPPVATSTP